MKSEPSRSGLRVGDICSMVNVSSFIRGWLQLEGRSGCLVSLAFLEFITLTYVGI